MRMLGRFLIISCLFSISCVFQYSYAQSEHRTTLRAGKHPNYIRVVFVSSAEVVKNASVMLQKDNSIRVDLKSSTELDVQPLGVLKNNTSAEPLKGLTISAKDGVYYIRYDSINDITVSKLANPHRLIIDINTNEKKQPAEDTAQGLHRGNDIPPTTGTGSIETVIIDPGHGGDDKGIVGSKTTEKEMALSFARELSNILSKKGKKVTLTRKQDNNLSLRERQSLVKGKRVDLLLSVHLSPTDEMVIYPLSKDKTTEKVLADFYNAMKQAAKSSVNLRVSSIMPSMYQGIATPALLIELPNPDSFNYDKKNRDTLLSAIATAVSGLEVAAD